MIFSNYGLNFVQIIHGRQRLVSRNIYELFIPVQRAYFEILVGYQSEITGFISSSDQPGNCSKVLVNFQILIGPRLYQWH